MHRIPTKDTKRNKHPLFRGTALSFAAHWGNDDIVHLLLSRGQLQKQNIQHALQMTEFEWYRIPVFELSGYSPYLEHTEEGEMMAVWL